MDNEIAKNKNGLEDVKYSTEEILSEVRILRELRKSREEEIVNHNREEDPLWWI